MGECWLLMGFGGESLFVVFWWGGVIGWGKKVGGGVVWGEKGDGGAGR